MGKKSLAIIAVLLVSGGCSRIETVRAPVVAPPPEAVQSLLLQPAIEPLRPSDYLNPDPEEMSVLETPFPERRGWTSRTMDKALAKMAGVVYRMRNPTLETLVDKYERSFDSLEEKYDNVEDFFVSSAGIKREEFRQGLGITTAAAATALGALHAIRPAAVSSELFGTKIRAGYDVSRLDDPRIVISYDRRYNFVMGKEGLGGQFGSAHGITYSGDINIRKAQATADMTFRNGVQLGTLYSLRAEEVKGYMSLRF